MGRRLCRLVSHVRPREQIQDSDDLLNVMTLQRIYELAIDEQVRVDCDLALVKGRVELLGVNGHVGQSDGLEEEVGWRGGAPLS